MTHHCKMYKKSATKRKKILVSRYTVFLMRQMDKRTGKTKSAVIVRNKYPKLFNFLIKIKNEQYDWSIIQIVHKFSSDIESDIFYKKWKKQSRGPRRRINEGINLAKLHKKNNPHLSICFVPFKLRNKINNKVLQSQCLSKQDIHKQLTLKIENENFEDEKFQSKNVDDNKENTTEEKKSWQKKHARKFVSPFQTYYQRHYSYENIS